MPGDIARAADCSCSCAQVDYGTCALVSLGWCVIKLKVPGNITFTPPPPLPCELLSDGVCLPVPPVSLKPATAL
jgi:hypothetical protein